MTLEEMMILIYVNLVRMGRRTLEQVPTDIRAAVQAVLEGGHAA